MHTDYLFRQNRYLTQNKMTVVEHQGMMKPFSPKAAMALCSDAQLDDQKEAIGEPTECTRQLCIQPGPQQNDLNAQMPRIGEAPLIPFAK